MVVSKGEDDVGVGRHHGLLTWSPLSQSLVSPCGISGP